MGHCALPRGTAGELPSRPKAGPDPHPWQARQRTVAIEERRKYAALPHLVATLAGRPRVGLRGVNARSRSTVQSLAEANGAGFAWSNLRHGEIAMRKLVLVLVAVVAVAMATDSSYAQGRGGGGGGSTGGSPGGGSRGGGSPGAGSWGGSSGSSWHGGGGWNSGGRGSSWHGGGSWNSGWRGGSWHGRGSWNSGWRGGSWNHGWHGAPVRWGGWGWGGWWGPPVSVSIGTPWVWGGSPWAWGGSPWVWGGGPWWSGTVVSSPVFVSAPTVFVEAPPSAEATPPAPVPPVLWYYCTNPAGYFPYVQNCTEPWIKVVPPAPAAATPSGRIAPAPFNAGAQTAPAY